ncbi:iron uptake transporter deferrochelatase/peroxidase subunit [Staphylococcus massiliensis]|uniref:iron uptake transporter deferrochelatase/peroxidase subunit n=1 Tax=Staphylococcus massiliensis TaxID=555791 RepID=UPI000474C9A6|nr:iron uptake transporter deferrochelatase/peroxidase subunit [Staphylococcus massiliensis]MCG3400621.1 deferrochelatase/peroxidase EfeB [Staphylococcus massiliensis]MCG3411643.1 deferrochelatase/peroxidase EfeB [Staphylococcus massiliensis]PNZ99363.1 deferrochelatase/peroxidase EfeB [Staphylococcus massiliensis CCUG 55927]
MSKNEKLERTYSRRSFLKMLGIGGAGLVISSSGIGQALSHAYHNSPKDKKADRYAFYGKYQTGIITPQQSHAYIIVLNLKRYNAEDVQSMLKAWTQMSNKLMSGQRIGSSKQYKFVPPDDTGETIGLNTAQLTLTFGLSRDALIKLKVKDKIPDAFVDLPHFPKDQLDRAYTGGDILIQACSNDLQVCFHAIRNLIRPFRHLVQIHWGETGFVSQKGNETPRNLMAFKDGTVNPKDQHAYNKHVFIPTGPFKNGTYMVLRRIQMHLETWDRTALEEQENTFGRYRESGAPLGKKDEFDTPDLDLKTQKGEYVIPQDAHIRLAKESKQKILRRSYSYANGLSPITGSIDSGLLFISFQRTPQQFIDIQNRLGHQDNLNEYITHRGSGLFLMLPGVPKGGILGETLWH